jgi:hypothetical protein
MAEIMQEDHVQRISAEKSGIFSENLLSAFILLVGRDLLFGSKRSGFYGDGFSLGTCRRRLRAALTFLSSPFLISIISHERTLRSGRINSLLTETWSRMPRCLLYSLGCSVSQGKIPGILK